MRKILTGTILAAFVIQAGLAWGATFYVAPDGSDTNPGTEAAPFASLEKPRDAVRAQADEGGHTVILRGGVYERTAAFELGAADSGVAGKPVVYRAQPGESVHIMGGKVIPGKAVTPVKSAALRNRIIDEAARDKVRQIDLKAAGVTDYGKVQARGFRRPYIPAHLEIFVDNEALHLARYPNAGVMRMGDVLDPGSKPRQEDFANKGGVFKYTDKRHERWTQAEDLWFSGLFCYGYADDTIRVASIDPAEGTVTMAQAHMYGLGSGKPFNAYFALNLLEEIDAPGEFFVDHSTGVLVFYPPEGFSKQSSISVSVLEEPMVAMEGASHVHFENITFECARGMGIYIERGEACRILGCTIRNLGMVGVCIGQGTEPLEHYAHQGTAPPASRALGSWHEHIYDNTMFDRKGGRNHGIVSCDIHNVGSGAISLGGGNRASLTPAGNFVRNCVLHDFNRLDRSYRTGVNIDGVGNRIEHCFIHSAPGTAVYLHGNDHVMEYTEICNVMVDGDDMGAVYLGRDPSEFGNTFRYNYLHHIGLGDRAHGTMGFYYDDGACGSQAYGNVLVQAGKLTSFLIGGGKYNVTENNILVECALGARLDNRCENWSKKNVEPGGIFHTRLDAVAHTKPPYSERYPQLAKYWDDNPAHPANPVRKNLFVRCKKAVQGEASWGPFADNLEVEADPGFVDMAGGDFTLKPDAEAFTKIPGFKPVPFATMGLYRDAWRTQLPAGAKEGVNEKKSK